MTIKAITIAQGSTKLPPLSAEDQKLLSDMCSPNSETGLVLNGDQSPDKILHSLYLATQAAGFLERRRDGLVIVIGKILSICKNTPAVYHVLGYRSFDMFIKKHVVDSLGMSKSTLRDAMAIYEAFPTTSAADVAAVGVVKMNLLRRITNSTQPGHAKMIEAAKTQTYSQLLQTATEKANLPAGDVLRSVIAIPCTKSIHAMWKRFLEDPRVRAKCQTEDPGTILEYAMAEALSTWADEE